MLLSIQAVAQALGGEVNGGQVLAPGPGHSPQDRSLSVKVDPAALDGFVVHSFASDDPIACRDYVREKLDLPPFRPTEKKSGTKPPFSPVVARYTYRDANSVAYLQVQRTASKHFLQYHWTGNTWRPGKPKGPKVPYHLPELIKASGLPRSTFVKARSASRRWRPAVSPQPRQAKARKRHGMSP